MSLKSAPYYWIECDGCGARIPEPTWGVPAALPCPEDTRDYAIANGWMPDGWWYCPSCIATIRGGN